MSTTVVVGQGATSEGVQAWKEAAVASADGVAPVIIEVLAILIRLDENTQYANTGFRNGKVHVNTAI